MPTGCAAETRSLLSREVGALPARTTAGLCQNRGTWLRRARTPREWLWPVRLPLQARLPLGPDSGRWKAPLVAPVPRSTPPLCSPPGDPTRVTPEGTGTNQPPGLRGCRPRRHCGEGGRQEDRAPGPPGRPQAG